MTTTLSCRRHNWCLTELWRNSLAWKMISVAYWVAPYDAAYRSKEGGPVYLSVSGSWGMTSFIFHPTHISVTSDPVGEDDKAWEEGERATTTMFFRGCSLSWCLTVCLEKTHLLCLRVNKFSWLSLPAMRPRELGETGGKVRRDKIGFHLNFTQTLASVPLSSPIRLCPVPVTAFVCV